MAAFASSRSVLVGSERNTGPHGDVAANFMPRRVVSGIDAVVFAAQYHLVIGWVMTSWWSVSWNSAPPVPCMSRTAAAGAAAAWPKGASDCATDLAAMVLIPRALRPVMSCLRDIP